MLEVVVFVVDGGGLRHDSSLRSITIGVHKSNSKFILVELWITLMFAVSYK